MKFLIVTYFFIYSVLSIAGEISFIGPCNSKPMVKKTISFDGDVSVGEVTILFLQDHNIDFIGTSQGLNSIFNSPVGDEALEILSDTELKAYGWCYSVNGIEPSTYPNEVKLKKSDKILWWFGYAHYKKGSWISQCTPSYLNPSKLFCD